MTVWLNPEPRRIWDAPTIDMIRRLFPMFELTLEGVEQAVDVLRGAKAVTPYRGGALLGARHRYYGW